MPNIIDNPNSELDAFTVARDRGVMPTNFSTDEIRELDAELRARSVFTARGTSALFASEIKRVVEEILAGDISQPEARAQLGEVLDALGYTPEAGFAGTEAGQVPPAVRGSLRDLRSFRRLDLIIRTQIDLMRGAGQQMRGHDPERLDAFPCWELVRRQRVRVPREWEGRWTFAGGTLYDGRMIAPKGDPVWGEIGSSLNFDDSLDVDHPPFAFNSGMGWSEVGRMEALDLGVTATDGTSIDEFLSPDEDGRVPRVIRGQLPRPSMSLKGMDRKIIDQVLEDTKGEETTPGVVDYSDLLEAEVAADRAEYEGGAQ